MKCNRILDGFSNSTKTNVSNSDANSNVYTGNSDYNSIIYLISVYSNTNTTGNDTQSQPVNVSLIIIIVASALGLCCSVCTLYVCYKCYTKRKANNNIATPNNILPIYLNNPNTGGHNFANPDFTFNNPLGKTMQSNSIVRKLNYMSPVKDERPNSYYNQGGIERQHDPIYRPRTSIYEDVNDPYDYVEEDNYMQSIPHRRYIIDRNYTEVPRTRTMRRMYPSYTEY
jgi:hypothetical protein